MRLTMYSIFDTASKSYMRPFFCAADGEAMRLFADIVNDGEHPVGKHPEDYSVFRIGMFDDNKGSLHPEDPECLAVGLELVKRSTPNGQL